MLLMIYNFLKDRANKNMEKSFKGYLKYLFFEARTVQQKLKVLRWFPSPWKYLPVHAHSMLQCAMG